jgi:hypothetical protein
VCRKLEQANSCLFRQCLPARKALHPRQVGSPQPPAICQAGKVLLGQMQAPGCTTALDAHVDGTSAAFNLKKTPTKHFGQAHLSIVLDKADGHMAGNEARATSDQDVFWAVSLLRAASV